MEYRTPLFIHPFPWRLHITITYILPHLRLCYANVVTVITGSRLHNISDVKTRTRRNVFGINMIRNNVLFLHFEIYFCCKIQQETLSYICIYTCMGKICQLYASDQWFSQILRFRPIYKMIATVHLNNVEVGVKV